MIKRKTIKGMGKTTGIRKKDEDPGDTMLLTIHRKVTISVLTNIY